jgi:hypothetical protein
MRLTKAQSRGLQLTLGVGVAGLAAANGGGRADAAPGPAWDPAQSACESRKWSQTTA